MPGNTPLIVMLHGNHGTCGRGSNPRVDSSCAYTDTGRCPAGYVPTPNHEGYNYLAENLASYGYLVVSINANRGITCGGGDEDDWGLNLARGRLVLKHLSLLYQWAVNGGAPKSIGLGENGLVGKIDFANVGLFGHSRGGEGVRAAYNLYLDKGSIWPARIPGLNIKGIFEVGAVDGQTPRVLDANGTAWNQLLPMCDGDVYDLEGRYPYERMLMNKTEKAGAQKSLYEVWGANHNFFNTEWQESDAYQCMTTTRIFDPEKYYSKEQQMIALASVPAFFRSHLGANNEATMNQNFNPLVTLPPVVTDITQVDRDFTPSPGKMEALVVDDFDRKTGVNSSGYENISRNIAVEHRTLVEEQIQRAAVITWQAANSETYFETVWAAPGHGRDIHSYATLDFRIARNALDQNPITDFSVMLEDASGQLSNSVSVSNYTVINGPGNMNIILKSVRIPLTEFKNVNFTRIHGVRFIFDKTQSDTIYLANVRLHRHLGLGSDSLQTTQINSMNVAAMRMNTDRAQVEYVAANMSSIRVIHKAGVEIVVASQVAFPAMDRLPVLKIGGQEFKLSRYSDMNYLKELTFTLTEKQYAGLEKTADVTVEDGKVWKFASLAEARMQ